MFEYSQTVPLHFHPPLRIPQNKENTGAQNSSSDSVLHCEGRQLFSLPFLQRAAFTLNDLQTPGSPKSAAGWRRVERGGFPPPPPPVTASVRPARVSLMRGGVQKKPNVKNKLTFSITSFPLGILSERQRRGEE